MRYTLIWKSPESAKTEWVKPKKVEFRAVKDLQLQIKPPLQQDDSVPCVSRGLQVPTSRSRTPELLEVMTTRGSFHLMSGCGLQRRKQPYCSDWNKLSHCTLCPHIELEANILWRSDYLKTSAKHEHYWYVCLLPTVIVLETVQDIPESEPQYLRPYGYSVCKCLRILCTSYGTLILFMEKGISCRWWNYYPGSFF